MVPARRPDRLHALVALELEGKVADSEDLVDEEDLGLGADSHREPQPHEHARRVELHRGVDELLELGERDDLVQSLPGLPPGQPEEHGVEHR